MKRFYNSRVLLTLFVMALFATFLGGNEALAQATSEEFTFTSNKWAADNGNWAGTKDGNQLTKNQGVQITTSTTGAVVTSPKSFSNVEKVVVTYCTNKSSGAGSIKIEVGNTVVGTQTVTKASSEGTTLKNFTFTPTTPLSGNVKFTVNCTSNSIYINKITVYYTPDGGGETDPDQPVDATFSVNPAALSVKVGETAEATIVTNYNGTITVTSNEESIAEAIYADGTILVEGKAAGKTTLSITGTGSEKYNDINETIEVTVSEKAIVTPGEETEIYHETFGIPSKNTDFAPNSSFLTDKSGIEVEGTGIKFSKSSQSSYEGASQNGNIFFSGASGSFIIKAGNLTEYKNVTLHFGAMCNWGGGKDATLHLHLSKDGGINYTEITIKRAVDKSGWYTFDVALDDYLDNLYIKFENTGSNTNRLDDIKITGTKKDDTSDSYTLNVSATGYSTLCLDKAYTMPEGLEGAVVSVSDNILTVDYVYTTNDVVAAGMPLLIKAAKPGEYTLNYSSEEGTDLSSETMMSGETDADGMTVGAEGSKFYKLAAPEGKIGFYWGAQEGAAFKNGADKAYLVVPGTVNVQGFRFDGTTTGIAGIAGATDTDAAIYTLDGRRVSGKADTLPRGIYIVGGKKVIK